MLHALQKNYSTSLPGYTPSIDVEIICDEHETPAGSILNDLYQQSRQSPYPDLLNFVLTHFDSLNHGSLPSLISPVLKEAIVILIMSKKSDLTLSPYDMETTFSELEKKATGDAKIALRECLQHNLAEILKEAVDCHNLKTGKGISFQTGRFTLLPEIHYEINRYLSLQENAALSRVSNFYLQTHCATASWLFKIKTEHPEVNHLLIKETPKQIFMQHPEYRIDKYIPCDAAGLAYLKSIDITHFLQIREIKNGVKTINDIFANRKCRMDALQKLLNASDLSRGERENLEAWGVQKFFLSGVLTMEQARNLIFEERIFLSSSGIHKYIDEGLLSLDHAFRLDWDAISSLNAPEVQCHIDNKFLELDAAIKLTWIQRYALRSVNVTKYIQLGLLTFASALNLTDVQTSTLDNLSVQKYIELGILKFEAALKLTRDEANVLLNLFIQERIDLGILKLEDVIKLTPLEIHAMSKLTRVYRKLP